MVDTVAASYVLENASEAGRAAEKAATRKLTKYSDFQRTYLFVPLAVETMGPINDEGLAFVSEIGRRLSRISGDLRETGYLF